MVRCVSDVLQFFLFVRSALSFCISTIPNCYRPFDLLRVGAVSLCLLHRRVVALHRIHGQVGLNAYALFLFVFQKFVAKCGRLRLLSHHGQSSVVCSAAVTRRPMSLVWLLDGARVHERPVYCSGLIALRIAGTLTKTLLSLVVSTKTRLAWPVLLPPLRRCLCAQHSD